MAPRAPTSSATEGQAAASEGAGKGQSNGDEKVFIHIRGYRIDCTHWLNRHPGGRKVLHIFQDRDATEQFDAMHSKDAEKILEAMIKKSSPVPEGMLGDVKYLADPLRVETQELRRKLEQEGLFKPNIFFEVMKLIYVFGSILGGGYILYAYPDQLLLGWTILMLGWLQAGWVGHDYSHHSVFASPKLNDRVSTIVGALQGYNVMWWKARHNTHHVVTNEVGNDPDIKTSPIFHFVQQYPDLAKKLKSVQKYQNYYYLPVVATLDLYWRYESIEFILRRFSKMKFDAVLLVLHYIGLAFVIASVGWMPIFLCSLVRGFLTGVIVFSSHYAEERIDGRGKMSFFEQTLRTSHNISGNSFLHFMTGYISMQVEHHLFPTMPRSNLPYVRKYVQAIAKKHNIKYSEDTVLDCIRHNLKSLTANAKLD